MSAHDNEQHDIPPKLKAELLRTFGETFEVPHTIDDAIRNRALARLVGRRRRTLIIRWASAAAAAAIVLVTIKLALPPASPPVLVASVNDLNADGSVNVLDALILATKLETNQPAIDANGDGHVDRSDVDAIAMIAVRLNRGTTP
jgi:hypothetical protein